MDRPLAEEIISEWRESDISGLVRREMDIEIPTTGKTVAIIGPRRAGKSFFMYDIIFNRIKTDIMNTLFLNLEDHRFGIPEIDDLDTIISIFEGRLEKEGHGGKRYLFLDEVQNVEGWERYVRSIMDRTDLHIFISGSSSKLLSKEIATSMRGRSVSYLVLPFSFREYLNVKKVKLSRSPRSRSLILQHLKDYMKFGGFPEVVLEAGEMTKKKILRNYVEVMLFRDIIERYGVRNIKVLKLLMGQMISSTANSLSLNKFNGFLKSQGIKTDKNSIYEYKDHLLDAFGFIELKRIDGSFRTIEQGNHKIYPIDTGYLTDFGYGIDSNMGRTMETVVAIELFRRIQNEPDKRMNFWRENSEIDFVISDREKVVELIQVSFSIEKDDTLRREVDGLISGSKELGCDELLLLNWDKDYEIHEEGKTIKVRSLWLWLTDPDYA